MLGVAAHLRGVPVVAPVGVEAVRRAQHPLVVDQGAPAERIAVQQHLNNVFAFNIFISKYTTDRLVQFLGPRPKRVRTGKMYSSICYYMRTVVYKSPIHDYDFHQTTKNEAVGPTRVLYIP